MGIYKPGRPTKFNPNSGKGVRPPSSPGEYRIRDGKGKISYIGETCDLNRRTHEHTRSGKIERGGSIEYKVADGRSTSATRRKHERSKIGEHNPYLNCSKGGEGRKASRWYKVLPLSRTFLI